MAAVGTSGTRGGNVSVSQHILIIDDEENMRYMLSVMLARQGYCVDKAADGSEGLSCLMNNIYDFILCDIRMPEMDGKTFLVKALEEHVAAPIIMMSAYGTVEVAVECMKLGAYDFISKPFKKDEIVMVLKKAEERERLKEENCHLRDVATGQFSYSGILSRNIRMQEIFSQIRKVADMKTAILVLGESGSGKELVAQAIHDNGIRSQKPFVAVNCGAIPENLLESELFGHIKGAFTDASGDKAGLFEQADGGTLFLDEIGEMPLALQVKLLRVLQEGEIRRVGDAVTRKVDVRVISATSRDLSADVGTGRFREDLYFRINVFCLELPPLRDRVEDIPVLVEHFLRRYGSGNDAQTFRVEPDAMRRLMAHRWPGNVRELENVIERACILCEGGRITSGCLPPSVCLPDDGFQGELDADENLSIKKAEDIIERDLIRKALVKTCGNRTQAAKILEISHRSLLYKIKEYGIE
ncbi:MAG: sigma-54-dependent Fis family transcriptional regulator [Geobacteraceae bacterium]|nr:sigma-54-dependent Fis family transcriptional regulator [Geobacteraceae bacterium]NTW79013.1 sigma-54-dependent Fis family transcriptional regulator [Geobacteraceae bacterium]